MSSVINETLLAIKAAFEAGVNIFNGNGTFENPVVSTKPHPSWPVGDRFLNVGYDVDGVTDGYINDLRISDGAVYTANFTPPTSPF